MGSLLKFIVGLCLLAIVGAQTNPVVDTSLGKIKGSILKTDKGLDINAFRGIRYAQAPVGDKRFKAPVAVTAWDTELDATEDGYMCPQPKKSADVLSEDCLILNVYSRDLTVNKSVIFYIHGGANKIGGSNSMEDTGPEFLLDSDIVLVSVNYRLGAFGFLTTRTADSPGNYAYLDQVMALEWVQEHISNFGGNPASVTILGQSAGSMAVTLHMSSPLSKGLFHRAIAMSGSVTNHHDIDNLYWTTYLGRQTSCPMYNPTDLLSCLRELSWETIVEVSDAWVPYKFESLMEWNYEIDGHFLNDHPTTLFSKGDFNKVPLLTGITKDEFTFLAYSEEGNTGLFNDITLNFDKYGPEFFVYSPHDSGEISEQLKAFYLHNQTINEQDIDNFGKLFADSIIAHGVHRLVDLARRHMDVYYYRFDYAGNSTASPLPGGVPHGGDLPYIFKIRVFNGQSLDFHPEQFMVDRIVGWFSSFAEKGAPDSDVQWIPCNDTHLYTMYNDEDLELGDEPFTDRFGLWDSLFPIALSGSNTLYATSMLSAVAVLLHVLVKYVF